ncbi:hypothetical protein MMC31_000820 [Peltigera leucophlebia]|nr:hypothetical protein [Peltigera leucophlebia]
MPTIPVLIAVEPSGELSILRTEVNLQLNNNGLYGFDTVQIGSPGKGNATVDHQVVAGIATPDFYLGSLGLHNRKVLFQVDEFRACLMVSPLGRLNVRELRARVLTLGGYDAARFTPNDVGFQFSTNQLRQKLVWLQSIWYTDSNSGNLLSLPKGPILTLADSTVPHIWLPPETCKAFEKAFGLTYNRIANLYLINDTIHSALIKQNPSIIFNNADPGPAINITLPITKSRSLPSTPSGSSGRSKSLATPAIAIAVAIVAIILAAFGIWFCQRRRQCKRPTKETPELPAYPIPPHSAAELAYNGNQGNEITPGLIVTEASGEKIQSNYCKKQILMEQAGHDPSRGVNPAELAGGTGSDLLRPELPSSDPSNRHELSSSEADC